MTQPTPPAKHHKEECECDQCRPHCPNCGNAYREIRNDGIVVFACESEALIEDATIPDAIDQSDRCKIEEQRQEIERLKGQLANIHCHAAMDGECSWEFCPQLRDKEPARTGRHCPLDFLEESP